MNKGPGQDLDGRVAIELGIGGAVHGPGVFFSEPGDDDVVCESTVAADGVVSRIPTRHAGLEPAT